MKITPFLSPQNLGYQTAHKLSLFRYQKFGKDFDTFLTSTPFPRVKTYGDKLKNESDN